MPYHACKVFPEKKLHSIGLYDSDKKARGAARELRNELPREDGYMNKIIFANIPDQAERMLSKERDPVPDGVD